MNKMIHNILYDHHFKGCYSIHHLPTFEHYPGSYLIFVDSLVWMAVIRYENGNVVLFNPARSLVAIPPELVEDLSFLNHVTILNCDYSILVKHMMGICIYFIFHCMSSLDNLNIAFPPSSSHIQHMLNIHDFLKVKCPIHFNSW